MKFYPDENGGAGKVLAMLKGGGTKSFGVVFMQWLEVLVILKGGAKSVHSLKGGRARKVLPCLEGGGAKSFGPMIFHFVAPPLPIINDQSLSGVCPFFVRCR